jgi:hypothetical protein
MPSISVNPRMPKEGTSKPMTGMRLLPRNILRSALS